MGHQFTTANYGGGGASAFIPPPPPPPPPGDQVLFDPTQHLTYLGSFNLNSSYTGDRGAIMTVRPYSGVEYLLVRNDAGSITRVPIPTLRKNTDPGFTGYLTSNPDRNYGAFTGTYRNTQDPGQSLTTTSVYWDEIGQRLYWTFENIYNIGFPNSPSIGSTVLNETPTPTCTAIGSWHFSGLGCKPVDGGVVGIPQTFADAYCGGKRLGVGFGGPKSGVASGDASFGPSCVAIDPIDEVLYPPNASTPWTGAAIPFQPLVGYWPYNANPGAGRGRADTPSLPYAKARPGSWMGGSYPAGETWPLSKWEGSSWNKSGAMWIDTPTCWGLVGLASHGMGEFAYVDGGTGPECFQLYWWAIDPADIITVTAGTTARYAIQPKHQTLAILPDYDTSKFPMQAPPTTFVNSALQTLDCGATCGGSGTPGKKLRLTSTNVAVTPGFGFVQGHWSRVMNHGTTPADMTGQGTKSGATLGVSGSTITIDRKQQQPTYSGNGFGAPDVTASTPGTWSPATEDFYCWPVQSQCFSTTSQNIYTCCRYILSSGATRTTVHVHRVT